MSDAIETHRVVYVGTGRRRGRKLGPVSPYESEQAWRPRLAQEMEDVCQEMARRGLRLAQVVPVLSSVSLQGAWTEGAWIFFTCPESSPSNSSS